MLKLPIYGVNPLHQVRLHITKVTTTKKLLTRKIQLFITYYYPARKEL